MNVISRYELESINFKMIGRGQPDKKDDIGYNVPDFNKLSSLWFGCSDNDIYEISSRLIKYYDTQLDGIVDFTKEKLIYTTEYYKKIVDSKINKSSVTIGLGDLEDKKFSIIAVGFKYNEDFISVMRKYKYTFDRDIKSWSGSIDVIKPILRELEEKGADVENCHKYLNYLEDELLISISDNITEDINTSTDSRNILMVKEIDNEIIALKFDFDYELVEYIKMLKYKRFDWDTKEWFINKYEVKSLYENILHIDIDSKQLIPYLESDDIPLLEVVSISDRDIEISFPYIPEIVDKIKNLTFYKFNRNNEIKTWTIDIREKDKLVEYIEDVIDCVELKAIRYEDHRENIALKDYSYLSRKPFKHQLQAGQFLLNNRKALLCDEMGSGKTMSSVLAAYSLPSPRLIICPASLKLNWANEIRIVDTKGSITVVSSTEQDTNYNADWVIVNYDLLENKYNSLSKLKYSCLIMDESHYIKSVDNQGNPNSTRARYSMALAEQTDYVFLLTGTPITNKPKDLFNLLKICDHIVTRNFFNYGVRFCNGTHSGFGWSFEGSSNEDELHEILKPLMLRRLKKDMLDLPKKNRRFIPVDINMGLYHRAVQEYINEKNKLSTQGQHLTYLNAIKHILAVEKTSYTIEIAENILSCNESVVIFTNYNAVVNKLMARFGDIAVKITGSCSTRDRQSAVEEFQSGRKKVIVANIIAGGVGITLIKSNNLIFNDFDWIPANHFQAEDRIHRIGQTKSCNVNYVYVPNAEIDDYMINMLDHKSTYINKIVDGGKGEHLNIIQEVIKNMYKAAS